jgi:hypothetical protein
MIFPDITLEVWLQKYPDLKIQKMKCECKSLLSTTVPFVCRLGWGITTPKCSCGSSLSKTQMVLKPKALNAVVDNAMRLK